MKAMICFSMTPMGLEGGSMGQQAAEVQKIMDQDNLKTYYIVHSQAVDIEGEWDEALVIDTHTDKENTCEAKMQAVMAACGQTLGGKVDDAHGPPTNKKARIEKKAEEEE